MNEYIITVLIILICIDISVKILVMAGISLGDSDFTLKDFKIVLIPFGFLYYIPIWVKHFINNVKALK